MTLETLKQYVFFQKKHCTNMCSTFKKIYWLIILTAEVKDYAKAAVMMAMEYTSMALHPRDKSFTGAFNPNKIGP